MSFLKNEIVAEVAAPFRVRNLRRLKPSVTEVLRFVTSETASCAGIDIIKENLLFLS